MNMFKYNNSYTLYIANKLYYKIANFFIKQINEHALKEFEKKQKECIWCKRIHTNDSYFCSEKCKSLYEKEKFQSFKHNNRCEDHRFDILTYKNECWSCYKEQYYKKRFPKVRKRIFLRMNHFKLYPTFRTSKDSWNGDKIAFEENLLNNKIKYFVYIKFFIDKKGKAIPIVCGKSGSSIVNSSGSDLSFSIDIDHGPARKFLNKNKLEWCYDLVFIRKCKDQKHAYEIERTITKKFKLFGS